MTKPQCPHDCPIDAPGHGAHHYHYHGFLAAQWIEEHVGFDTSAYCAALATFPVKADSAAIIVELKAQLYAATGMHPQHYAAIYHQISEAEAAL